MRASIWLTATIAAFAAAPALAQPGLPALDRYGGEASSPAPPPERFLEWAGKTAPAASVQALLYSPAPVEAPSAPSEGRGAAAQGGVRYYTIHRDYGLAPDPIPVPPQFFGPTADLSQPPAEANAKHPAGPSAAGALATQDVTGSAP